MTMVELQANEFQCVLPLYRAAGARFPLISVVIQNKQRGQVFADDRESPRSAIVVTNFGFTFFAGEEKKSSDAELAGLFATGGAFKPSYLLWYSPTANWQRKLDAIPDLARRRERVRLEFRADSAGWLSETLQSPAGFELKSLSFELIPKTEKFGVKLDSRFWASAADFVENGLGVCLVKDGEVVSLCYAAAVVDGLAEIDVVTDSEHRGLGLGYLVAQQFIRDCLSRGITPTWDCFAGNIGSMKLADKLGFTSARSYPFYSFNVPIECRARSIRAQ
jgi:RimJ/RimL family protein N-acetyltransferase